MIYDLFKHTLGSGPVYATLGNHDSYHQYVLCRLRSQGRCLHISEPRMLLTPWEVRWAISSAGQHRTCAFYKRALKIFSLGTTTTFRVYGNWNSGYRKLRLTRHARTMLRIVFGVPMGYELFPLTLTCVSVTTFLGRNELTQGHDPGYRYGRLRSRFL